MRTLLMKAVPLALAMVLCAGAAYAADTDKPGKSYKATRDITIDKQSGKLRKPNEEEIAELVRTLEELTQRPDAGLESEALPAGGHAVSLDGGFQGVILARPNADGSYETKCVFTFEEGAEFLGLVADDVQQ